LEKLRIRLKNCFGIRYLDETVDFNGKNAVVIYAPNGTMKTSFANTFKAIEKNTEPRDRLNPDAETICEVIKSCGSRPVSDEVLVIDSETSAAGSGLLPNSRNNILVASSELRQQYEEKTVELREAQQQLMRKISEVMGYRGGDPQRRQAVMEEDLKAKFPDIAKRMYTLLRSNERLDYLERYSAFPNFRALFEEANVKNLSTLVEPVVLDEYIKKYNELLEKSKYLRKGMFDHYNLKAVSDSLQNHSFFKANHSIILNPKAGTEGDQAQTFSGENAYSELSRLIEEEKRQLHESAELQREWERLDAQLSRNQQGRKLRELLTPHKDLLAELENMDLFVERYWTYIFKQAEAELAEYIDNYTRIEEELRQIVGNAEKEQTTWEKIIEDFNSRFVLPFKVLIGNKTDTVLGLDDTTVLEFKHRDKDIGDGIVDEKLLQETLSRGERRAVYFLDILYKLEIDKQQSGRKVKLLVIDDIADSFDYRNKHAIVHYLAELHSSGRYKMIIMTHNFDFFRSVATRLGLDHPNSYMVEPGNIKFQRVAYLNNVFRGWVNQIHSNKYKTVASIPFARNLADCFRSSACASTQRDEAEHAYNELTSMLHIKPNTYNLTIADLNDIYKKILRLEEGLQNDTARTVIDLIFECADEIANGTCCGDTDIHLEYKVILSMALRLKAEIYMTNTLGISNTSIFTKNQTSKLLELYKETFRSNSDFDDHIRVLNEVNIISPEYIHLNAFMYEPLIDIGSHRLKDLYSKVGYLAAQGEATPAAVSR